MRFLLFFLLVSQLSFTQENKLSLASLELTHQKVTYDSSYFSIPYPNRDVPKNKGVCADVVIRPNRKLGIDFQKKFMRI